MGDETKTDIVVRLRASGGKGQCGPIKAEAAREIEDLRTSVTAFGVPRAVQFAHDAGYPRGHLHPTHYDILARAGARMDDFVRHEETAGTLPAVTAGCA